MKTTKITGERIKQYLEEGKRFDGRKLDEFRDITIETGVSNQAEGSVRVKLGKTEVIVGIKMNVGTPYPDSPNKGNMMVTTELLPLSSKRFEYGPPRFPAIELGRLTDRFIRESNFIDFEKLCIKEGEKVWTVFIDVYSINHDGNLLDAAGIGAVAALMIAKMPEYDEKEEKVLFGKFTKTNIPLKKGLIIPTTIYTVGKNIIVDPTLEEEDVSGGRVTIGATESGVINSMQKGGLDTLSPEEMENILDLSEKVRKQVSSALGKVK